MNEYQQLYYAWLDLNNIKLVESFEIDEFCTKWAEEE